MAYSKDCVYFTEICEPTSYHEAALIPTLEQSNRQRAESILKDKTWEITDNFP